MWASVGRAGGEGKIGVARKDGEGGRGGRWVDGRRWRGHRRPQGWGRRVEESIGGREGGGLRRKKAMGEGRRKGKWRRGLTEEPCRWSGVLCGSEGCTVECLAKPKLHGSEEIRWCFFTIGGGSPINLFFLFFAWLCQIQFGKK